MRRFTRSLRAKLSVTRMTRSGPRLLAMVCLVLAASLPASATPIVITGQTGAAFAGGSTYTLGSDAESLPVSGTSSLHLVASVEDGDPSAPFGTPPGYYKATAQLHTGVDDTHILISGSTSASAKWDGVGEAFFWEGTQAGASVQITVAFDLTEPTLVRTSYSGAEQTGAPIVLENAALGLTLNRGALGGHGWYLWGGCPPSFPECGPLLLGLDAPSGAVLPAGQWTLSFELDSSTPQLGSCAWGCLPGSSSFSITVIPEPGTLAMIAFGLVGLGVRGRRRSNTSLQSPAIRGLLKASMEHPSSPG